ncbi:type I restriction-modification system endonuclease [Chromatiales bacterium (ex Bugula neritina AB1)]|nr:type I restriction-modification system endonuclease [Chromatiales bacterium (ex Bugula neritina AB1)]
MLVELGARAERYALDDPNTSMIKVRQLGELLAKFVAAKSGVQTGGQHYGQRDLIDDLFRARAIPAEIKTLFHTIRMEGNGANHAMEGHQGQAITLLRHARNVAVWFYRSHVDGNRKLGGFSPPVPTADTSQEAQDEIARLKALYEQAEAEKQKLAGIAADEAELRKMAEEDRETAFEELNTALELADETEQARAANDERLARLTEKLNSQATTVNLSAENRALQASHNEQVVKEELSEADTREIIDMQLRAAGWMANSTRLRHGLGARPHKGHDLAIAEWPTGEGKDKGRADYVLFRGLMPVAVVEAKKENVDVSGAITQAKRYSRDYKPGADEISPGGPWATSDTEYKIPFLYSSNGRAYLKQLKTKSGTWFLDARRSTNNPYPLDGWHSPLELKQMLDTDNAAAEAALQNESTDYLPLRYYQHDAVTAVEQAIVNGQRAMLVAMATGTGKTRTCIALCYRLIKARRFRRILFLVDRTSLGTQTEDSLKELKIDNLQTFADIYDVKSLGDITPDADTKFQIATIQGMVKRLLIDGDGSSMPTVGQYDCIVVDECHRGYNLDQELSDNELNFRDESDYISKYSRVLEYFDAVKIGLTATPAIHTTEIFGGDDKLPIYQYSYRQAVLDGYLVDHEPPLQIKTKLSEEGIRWEANEQVTVYNTRNHQTELFNTPDVIEFEIDKFNKAVINENFNRIVCEQLARIIDPTLPGKTLIYCVTDLHADAIVIELKDAFKKQYGQVEDNAVKKITGTADKPLELIRRYKNEQLPNVVVTVDLLTTGIDVPQIDKLVFMRRVRSRILYDQMIGRGTRLCEDLYGAGNSKVCFQIIDCVDMYSTLLNYTDMKPVVTRPNTTYTQLIDELAGASSEEDRQVIVDQLVAKLQRSKRRIQGERATEFDNLTGMAPESLVTQIRSSTPAQVAEWFADKTGLVEFLDSKAAGDPPKLYISDAEDEVREVVRGYGKNNQRPKDYLEEFRGFIIENQDKVAAINLCATRPHQLTRQSLQELQNQLVSQGYNEIQLRTAWREANNVDIAATIIGYIRNAILDMPVEPYEDRVNYAMRRILASQNWTQPQRQWLDRIGKQFVQNTLVDRAALDEGVFRANGGFKRLDKVFDGNLAHVLEQISEQIWAAPAQ